MNKEDYFKYYIQGSDHYLIPKDVFNELFVEMINWKEESKKQKEAINKYIDELEENSKLSELLCKSQQENQKYKEVIDKAIEYINHFSKESEVKIYGLPKCKVFIGDIEELLEILKEVN